ncbi:MAG: hypothetical protein CSB49_06055, partial [Proteobacteria bacterium]
MKTKNQRTFFTLLALAALVMLSASACTEENPRLCSNDKQCEDKAKAGTIDATFTKCYQPEGYCNKGCSSDSDCRNNFGIEGLLCNAQGQCVATEAGIPDGGPDGDRNDGPGGDGPTPSDGAPDRHDTRPDLTKPNGATCMPGDVCSSGHCVDGICCAVEACGAC